MAAKDGDQVMCTLEIEGVDEVSVLDLRITEAINAPVGGTIRLSSEKKLKPKALKDKSVTLTFRRTTEPRVFKLFVNGCAQQGRFLGNYVYDVEVGSKLKDLLESSQVREFRKQTTLEILQQVIKPTGQVWDKKVNDGLYKQIDYSIQHNEKDIDFMMFLLERDGLSLFYPCEYGQATGKALVVDSNEGFPEIRPRADGKPLIKAGAVSPIDDRPIRWMGFNPKVTPEEQDSKEIDFKAKQSMGGALPGLGLFGGGGGGSGGGGGGSGRSTYRGPGKTYRTTEGGEDRVDSSVAQRLAQIERDSRICGATTGTFASTCARIGAGTKFQVEGLQGKLKKGGGGALPYLLAIRVVHLYTAPNTPQSKQIPREHARGRRGYGNAVIFVPLDYLQREHSVANYRPAERAQRATVTGAQTGTVTGGDGSIIDKDGRIKVRRDVGEGQEGSTERVRVCSPNLGSTGGLRIHPGEGDEAIYLAEQGDPDKVVCVGFLPNPKAKQPVPKGIDTELGKKEHRSNHDDIAANPDVMCLVGLHEGGGQSELGIQRGKNPFMWLYTDTNLRMQAQKEVTVEAATLHAKAAQDVTIKSTAQDVTIEAATKIVLKVGPTEVEINSSGIVLRGGSISVEGAGGGAGVNVKKDGSVEIRGRTVDIKK